MSRQETNMEESTKYIKKLTTIKQSFTQLSPSWVKITTITMIAKFNIDINIELVRSVFEELGSLKLRPAGSNANGFEWSLAPTSFYNQVSLVYYDRQNKKAIKLFPNGSIQVAGCVDLLDCNRIISQLQEILRVTLRLPNSPECIEKKIAMINTNFSLNIKLNQYAVTQVFNRDGFRVSFDPDRYSAVKVKFSPVEHGKQVTASIFSTGKIIVTGAENLNEIAMAYKTIVNIIEANYNAVYATDVDKKDVFDDFMGWEWSGWGDFIEKKNITIS